MSHRQATSEDRAAVPFPWGLAPFREASACFCIAKAMP